MSSLHLAPDTHAITPPVFFTCRMPFLPPNQQLQSTEGFDLQKEDECKISNNNYAVLFQINFQFQKM